LKPTVPVRISILAAIHHLGKLGTDHVFRILLKGGLALFHSFPPTNDKQSKRRKGRLFTVANDIDSEDLLANASEDMLSISAIAAKLADDIEGSNRSVALALSRIADGAQLMVKRALDHLEELTAARQEVKT